MRFWKRVNAQGEATTVESYSHNGNITGAIEITEQEFDALRLSFPPPIPTPPNPDIARAQELLANSPAVITQPEMWELMRIFARLHDIIS